MIEKLKLFNDSRHFDDNICGLKLRKKCSIAKKLSLIGLLIFRDHIMASFDNYLRGWVNVMVIAFMVMIQIIMMIPMIQW